MEAELYRIYSHSSGASNQCIGWELMLLLSDGQSGSWPERSRLAGQFSLGGPDCFWLKPTMRHELFTQHSRAA
jgi:hypothetical protein